jgi:hypothetical protein
VSVSNSVATWVIILFASVAMGGWTSAKAEEGQFGTPKGAEGTRIFKATEHPFTAVSFTSKANEPHSSAVWEILRPGTTSTMQGRI